MSSGSRTVRWRVLGRRSVLSCDSELVVRSADSTDPTRRTDSSGSGAFDGRFDHAPGLIINQQHRREETPHEGGRWPISIMLTPAPDSLVANAVERLMLEAMQYAGPGHWPTGRIGTSHLTVRALEHRRESIPADDPGVRQYRAALRRACARCRPVTFRVTGLTLTPSTVMAVAVPTDEQADRLLDLVADALPDGPETAIGRRDIWYLNLMHFAADIADPCGLVDWVADRRGLEIGTVTIDRCRLVRWHFDPVQFMRPVPLAEYPLA